MWFPYVNWQSAQTLCFTVAFLWQTVVVVVVVVIVIVAAPELSREEGGRKERRGRRAQTENLTTPTRRVEKYMFACLMQNSRLQTSRFDRGVILCVESEFDLQNGEK